MVEASVREGRGAGMWGRGKGCRDVVDVYLCPWSVPNNGVCIRLGMHQLQTRFVHCFDS